MTGLRERLLSKCVADENGCWNWIASADVRGYGRVGIDGRPHLAHRAIYELLIGSIPAGLDLDHLCRNPSCVNPAHLEPVTRRENLLRGQTIPARNARKTHCPSGHPYDEVNTRWYRGGRRCRACDRDTQRRKRAAARGR